MNTGITFITFAINKKYHSFVKQLYDSMKEHLHFDWDLAIISDDPKAVSLKEDNCSYFEYGEAYKKEWPYPTLMRYHRIHDLRNELISPYLYMIDVDMKFVASPGSLAYPLVGTLHPGYAHSNNLPFETNPQSTAYLGNNLNDQFLYKYFCGGFLGGRKNRFLEMAETIRRNINIDFKKGIIARWHDESHVNYYFNTSTQLTDILTPVYCYPEERVNSKDPEIINRYPIQGNPILVALNKGK